MWKQRHVTTAPASVILIRLLVGAGFLSEGIQKFLFPDQLGAGRFLKIGLPSPEILGPLVGGFEILSGSLVLIGLLTRLAAIPLLVIMAVALTTTKWPILVSEGFWAMAHEARTDWSKFHLSSLDQQVERSSKQLRNPRSNVQFEGKLPAEQRSRLARRWVRRDDRSTEMRIDEIAAVRDAFARQAWKDAYAGLHTADEAGAQLEAEDLERLAVCAYMVGKDEASADAWTRAHSEWLRLRDVRRAARCTFWLVLDLVTRGERAQARGWLARTQHLLEDAVGGCAEQGLLLALTARLRIHEKDIDGAHDAAAQAFDLARRFDDSDLQVFSRLCFAQVVATRGDAAAATALFDEIMVAVTVGDVSPIGIGTVYCAVIEGCHALLDLGRAREWTEALSGWCDAQPDLVAFRGTCLVHRVELMRLGGAWSEATAEAERACEWCNGAAFYQLAELHRLRGKFAEADFAYRRATEYGQALEPGLPLLWLAQGQRGAAQAAIRRAVGEPQPPHRRAAVLAACVEIMIDGSDLQAARAAANDLTAMTALSEARYLRALNAQATGSLLLAEGDAAGALELLRQAWIDWQDIDAPWEAGRVRVLLGMTCRALGDEETAQLEFDAARRVFERLGAAPDLARVDGLRAPAAAASDGTLTSRERQILALIARGMTNRAIAGALTISDRTVDRHVSNILTKLDLPSRSAATAYAHERGLVPQRT